MYVGSHARFPDSNFCEEMTLTITTTISSSQNNFHVDVAPEVDTGTSNPDKRIFVIILSLPGKILG